MSSIRVLLVDDEEGFTTSMKRILGSRGFDVTVARDGLAALSTLGCDHFDVIILDVKMPGMDGIHVLSEVSRICPDSRVIMLTGHYALSEEEDALKKGVYAYLQKPYPILKLVDVLVAAASKNEHRPCQIKD